MVKVKCWKPAENCLACKDAKRIMAEIVASEEQLRHEMVREIIRLKRELAIKKN